MRFAMASSMQIGTLQFFGEKNIGTKAVFIRFLLLLCINGIMDFINGRAAQVNRAAFEAAHGATRPDGSPWLPAHELVRRVPQEVAHAVAPQQKVPAGTMRRGGVGCMHQIHSEGFLFMMYNLMDRQRGRRGRIGHRGHGAPPGAPVRSRGGRCPDLRRRTMRRPTCTNAIHHDIPEHVACQASARQKGGEPKTHDFRGPRPLAHLEKIAAGAFGKVGFSARILCAFCRAGAWFAPCERYG
jgi:hypothetical protein